MSFLGKLFGGGKATPSPPAPPPNIGDGPGEAVARETRSRLKKRLGTDESILSGSLGTPGAARISRPMASKTTLG